VQSNAPSQTIECAATEILGMDEDAECPIEAPEQRQQETWLWRTVGLKIVAKAMGRLEVPVAGKKLAPPHSDPR
jgi:hypothetical protein